MQCTVPIQHRNARQGFSLTELMVAMAIFLILMSALVTLFDAAVKSTRQGYASSEAFENARTALMTFDRDLSGAFMAKEFGEDFNFYGRHNGFMFVGALDEGALGRVTYVFHPELSKPGFETTITERWGTVEANVRRQFQRYTRENGVFGAAAAADVQGAVDALIAAYGVFAPEDYVEFTVQVETESLIRVEEPQVSDLDTFNMYVKRNAANTADIRLDWPYIDPLDPGRDPVYATLDANEAPQFDFLYGALNPDPATTTYDLRNQYANINGGGWTHPTSTDPVFLRVLGRDTFDALLRARKREFWIRMLTGEVMGVEDLDPAAVGPEADDLGYWYDEGLADLPTPILNDRAHNVINEYVVADGIIGRAAIIAPDGTPVTYGGAVLDALDAELKFTYGDGKNGSRPYFNAVENLGNPDDPYETMNYTVLTGRQPAGFVELDVVDVDLALADGMLNVNTTRKTLGSPLLPRLPQEVTPQFWVTRSKTRADAAGFRRFFEQTIQVPAATGRIPSAIIARTPGAAQ